MARIVFALPIVINPMPRELSAAVTAIKNSQRFTYYDSVEIQLPLGPGDSVPRVIHTSTAPITVEVSFDFGVFAYSSIAVAFSRAPRVSEQTAWTDALEAAFADSSAALLSAAQGLIGDLFTDSEYTDRMTSDLQFIEDLYHAYFGRGSDAAGLTFWLAALAGSDRNSVRGDFSIAVEFTARVARLNQPVETENDARDWGDLSEGLEFSLCNAENTYSDLIGQVGRRVYPAPAVAQRNFQLSDGSYEAVVQLVGFAKFGTLDGEVARVSIVPDWAADGTDIVEEVTQRCPLIYKGDACGTNDPSPTCSRLEDDTFNGCISKAAAPVIIDITPPNNRPRFGGVSQLAPTVNSKVTIRPTDPPWGPSDYDPDDPTRHPRKSWDFGGVV